LSLDVDAVFTNSGSIPGTPLSGETIFDDFDITIAVLFSLALTEETMCADFAVSLEESGPIGGVGTTISGCGDSRSTIIGVFALEVWTSLFVTFPAGVTNHLVTIFLAGTEATLFLTIGNFPAGGNDSFFGLAGSERKRRKGKMEIRQTRRRKSC
jgi:hypothetical protein